MDPKEIVFKLQTKIVYTVLEPFFHMTLSDLQAYPYILCLITYDFTIVKYSATHKVWDCKDDRNL